MRNGLTGPSSGRGGSGLMRSEENKKGGARPPFSYCIFVNKITKFLNIAKSKSQVIAF